MWSIAWHRIAAAMGVSAAAVGLGWAEPTTQPVDSQSELETRALADFSGGQYATALAELQKVAEELKDQPDRVGLIEEDIRVCQRQLADGAGTPAQEGPPSADQRKQHAPPRAGEVREMAIKELGNFQYDPEKGGGIPKDVMALSGMRVRLHEVMIPMDQAASITTFALVPSLYCCGFGMAPQIQHTIVVHVPKDKAVNYYPDEIDVEGTLTVAEKKEEGFVVSIFEVDCTSVRPVAQ
jgi:hypothetical protein